jgi:drug/metabolite transporter (DMT)-like permease
VAAVLALGAALAFGVSDIAGAVAARRSSALQVALGLQLAGLPVLLLGLLVLPGVPSVRAVALGVLAGAVGNLGLVLYLRSMAVGPVGVISPLSALVGAAVPVAWGVGLAGDELGPGQLLGVVTGLVAVVLVAYSPGAAERAYGGRGPLFALIAGVAFGLFFVVLDATPADSGLWPLVGSRLGGTLLLLGLLAAAPRPLPGRASIPLIALSGVTDMLANLLFLLATREGLLSLASLLASLYPVVALVGARVVLAERLTRLQGTGVVLALAATALLVG